MENQHSRTELLLGNERIKNLQNSHVLIVGLGGVGGIAAEMICRSGVGEMTILDADIVAFSNINRQLAALHSTVGKPKAEVLAARLRDINPELKLHVIVDFLEEEKIESLLNNKFDFVVDAIDTITPKVALIKACVEQNIPIVSSMGSGAKIDPSQVKITDISKTEHCALARTVRQRLSKLGIKKGVPVVASTECGNKDAVLLVDEKNKKSTTGTISYMPAVFGCLLASYVIRNLTS